MSPVRIQVFFIPQEITYKSELTTFMMYLILLIAMPGSFAGVRGISWYKSKCGLKG